MKKSGKKGKAKESKNIADNVNAKTEEDGALKVN